MSKSTIRTSPRNILRGPYARLLTPAEDGTYTAEILEFSGCFAEGDTAEEAIANLENTAVAWIEAAIEQGQEIPPPIAAHGHSGKIQLRLAKSIHKQAARFAERDDVSLNQFFATAVAARVGAEEFYDHLLRRLQSLPMFADLIVIQTSSNTGDFLTPMIPVKEPRLLTQSLASTELSADDISEVSFNAR